MHPRRTSHPYPLPPYRAVAGPSTFAALPPGAIAAHAVTAALSNPYMQNYAQFQSPHYAQSYNHYYSTGASYGAGVTPDGYTLSSTYTPGTQYGTLSGPAPARGQHVQKQGNRSQTPSHWFQPGHCRCTQAGCSFTGSQKSLETHMMDRHLIYPPGWENRKRKPDWDADPSLKGKPIPIQGTTVKLDTAEAIAEWIAERKNRFPTASRVEEKGKKLNEAIARGQLPPDNSRFPQNKRRRLIDVQQYSGTTDRGWGDRGRGRGRGIDRGRGRGKGRGGGTDRGHIRCEVEQPAGEEIPRSILIPTVHAHPLPPKPSPTSSPHAALNPEADSDSDSDSDSDAAPEVVSSKTAPPSLIADLSLSDVQAEQLDQEVLSAPTIVDVSSVAPSPSSKPGQTPSILKSTPRQPRRPPRNPFASRPSLLRNLLQPEIRMTVSNLSQAIRFLVDNDFLENVELRPGQANEKMIEVVESAATAEGELEMGAAS